MNSAIPTGPTNVRQLISPIDLQILEAAYGYTIKVHATTWYNLRTFYVLQDKSAATGQLYVQGLAGTVADGVYGYDFGTELSIYVNGIGRRIIASQISDIYATTGAGNDTVDFNNNHTWSMSIGVEVHGGPGYDEISGGDADDVLYGEDQDDIIHGGGYNYDYDIGWGGNGQFD